MRCLPERSCLIRPLLLDVLTGRKSLNQVISGSGLPLAAQSMVAVRERSTTLSWGPMSIVGNPAGSWSSVTKTPGKNSELNGYMFSVQATGESKWTVGLELHKRITLDNIKITPCSSIHPEGNFTQIF